MFIVNKLVLIYFTWFVHNFFNYKYNVLLKSNDVCLKCHLALCVCFTSIHREGFICLEQFEYQETDQRCCAEDVSFLFQVPSSLL